MTEWRYGDAWEEFPIESGEVWGVPSNGSRVAVHDIFEPLPAFMYAADLLFVDPPWNLGNINSFYTKAGRSDYLQNFALFERTLFQRIDEIAPQVCYLEIGVAAAERWRELLGRRYWHVQRWDVTYYRKHPCCILRGSHDGELPLNFTGIDEEKVIGRVAALEEYQVIGDLCMGRGLVGLAAYAAGKPFVGTELNKRRLAVLLQRLSQKGAPVARYDREGGTA